MRQCISAANTIYRARLTECSGALIKKIKCHNERWIDEFLTFLNLLVSAVCLILSGKELQTSGPAWLKQRSPKFSSSATFDVFSGVGGSRTGSTTGFSAWLHRVSQVSLRTSSVDLMHQCTQLVFDSVFDR